MNKIFTTIFTALVFSSCSDFQECNYIELKLKDACVKTDSIYTVSLASFTDFKWEALYVVEGPTIDDEVEEFIGISYKKVIHDNRRQYIFVLKNQIVEEYSSYCNLNLSKHPSCTIGHKYLYSSLVRIQKKKSEKHFIYKIEEVKE